MTKVLQGPVSYEKDPFRYAGFIVNSEEPFNCEPPPIELRESFITPVEKFYKRNHGPVPVLSDVTCYRLKLEGLLPKPISVSLQDIKSLPKVTVVATLQCAGNRRTEMSLVRKVKGVGWGLGAVGNASWGGARLSQVLELAGIPNFSSSTPSGGKYVEFISVDKCKEEKGGVYTASVPLLQATSPQADVILAYEMNGKELERDHGFPLRVVVPGVIGARSVKWLDSINICALESQGFFTQLDYKMFPPTVDWHNVDWPSRRPIMDFPVQSAITFPVKGDSIPSGTQVTVKGYALAGGGRGIERVDVSLDGGATWLEAKRLPQAVDAQPASYTADDESRLKWAWVFWELECLLQTPCSIVVRAVDTSAATQPENVTSIWNLRGVLNTSWHKVDVSAASKL